MKIFFVTFLCLNAFIFCVPELLECSNNLPENCPTLNENICAWMDPRINCVAKKYPCAKNTLNSCTACKIRDVVGYSKEACPVDHVMIEPKKRDRFSTLGIETSICSNESRSVEICTMNFVPTCAWLNESVKCGNKLSPCGFNASNPCVACMNSKVERISEGNCLEGHTVELERELN